MTFYGKSHSHKSHFVSMDISNIAKLKQTFQNCNLNSELLIQDDFEFSFFIHGNEHRLQVEYWNRKFPFEIVIVVLSSYIGFYRIDNLHTTQ